MLILTVASDRRGRDSAGRDIPLTPEGSSSRLNDLDGLATLQVRDVCESKTVLQTRTRTQARRQQARQLPGHIDPLQDTREGTEAPGYSNTKHRRPTNPTPVPELLSQLTHAADNP